MLLYCCFRNNYIFLVYNDDDIWDVYNAFYICVYNKHGVLVDEVVYEIVVVLVASEDVADVREPAGVVVMAAFPVPVL
jgi:hypothetical protein